MIARLPRGRPLPVSLLLAAIATAIDIALLALALGGAGALFAHHRALALIAVWAAGNLVLAVADPRRGHDDVRAERDSPLVLFALIALPTLAAPLSAWGERAGVATYDAGTLIHSAAVGLVGLGLAIRITAMMRLGPRFSPTVALQRDHALETGGLYARVRHPGYLGALLAAFGAALAFESPLGLVAVALLIPTIALRVRREERALDARFGDEFRAWRARTGSLLPRLGR